MPSVSLAMRARKVFSRALSTGAVRGACSAVVAGLALASCTTTDKGLSPMDASKGLSPMDAPAAPVDDGSPGDATGTTDADDAAADGASCGVPASFKWASSGALLSPVSDATHPLVGIKDPSVVYYNGTWHVFVSTVDAAGNYSIAQLSFPDWDHAGSATVDYLDRNPALLGYHAAPQIFYFTPKKKWYLIFQSGPPQYSTNTDIGNPAGWTAPVNFFGAEPAVVTQDTGTAGWLDFWVICDTANCYLFFSDDNGAFYRSQTTIGSFPSGFGNTVVVMKDSNPYHLFEASNVYLMKGTGKYLALVEGFDAASSYHRYFRSWTADSLDGTWTPLEDTFAAPFASTSNVTFTGTPWTNDISHGEMIRDGYDETLTIDTCHLQYLYQGYDPSAPTTPYNSIPWKLGLLTKTN
jgi:endo-1,4-beta-xylanase